MNILLIEDDAGLVELITENLEGLGFSIMSAYSGAEALAHLEKQTPDLMLLDYSLPDINGKELIETLLKQQTPLPPFIMTTGQGNEHIAVNMMKLGAMDYLVKNILFLEKLPDVVKRVVKEIESYSKLKQAEEALKESKERFELAMTATKDGLYDWNLVSNEIYYSPGWKSMLGYKEEELPNKFSIWEKLTEPEDMQKSWEMQQELISKQRDRFELEFKMMHKDGHWVDILSRAEAMFDKNDKAIRIVGTHVDISERKKTEEKIAREKKLFEDLFNNINSGVAIYKVINDGEFGEDYIIENFNKKSLELEGKKREEVVGKSLYDLRPNIDDYGLIPAFRTVWKTGIGIMHPTKAYVDENFSNYYENRVFRLPNNNIVAIYDDVTERMQNEKKIREAEKKLKNTFDLSPSIIAKSNLDTGYFIETNQAVTKILGYSAEEFKSIPFIELIHPDDQQKTNDKNDEQFEGKEVTFFENRYLCKDGSYKWMAWHGTKADENGIVTAIGNDISERKIVEHKIIETKQFYENITEGVQDGIWVTDKNDDIFYANMAMEKIAGVPREQIQGNNILKDLPNETTGELIKFYKQAKEEKKPIWYDIKVITPANKDTWQNGWLIPQYQNKAFTGIICTIRDVTERKQAEETLMKKMDEMQRFHNLTVNRELTMIELKREVNELLEKSGADKKYRLVR